MGAVSDHASLARALAPPPLSSHRRHDRARPSVPVPACADERRRTEPMRLVVGHPVPSEELVDEVAAEECYGFDRVPHRADLCPEPGAHSDRLGRRRGAHRPARRRPGAAGPGVRRARCRCGAHGLAGSRCAHGRLRHGPGHRVRHPDRGRVPRHVDPSLAAGWSTQMLGVTYAQGRPSLGLVGAADVRTPALLHGE